MRDKPVVLYFLNHVLVHDEARPWVVLPISSIVTTEEHARVRFAAWRLGASPSIAAMMIVREVDWCETVLARHPDWFIMRREQWWDGERYVKPRQL